MLLETAVNLCGSRRQAKDFYAAYFPYFWVGRYNETVNNVPRREQFCFPSTLRSRGKQKHYKVLIIYYYSQNAWLVKLDGKLVKKFPITASCHLAERMMSRFAHLEKFSLHSSSLSIVIYVRLVTTIRFSLWFIVFLLVLKLYWSFSYATRSLGSRNKKRGTRNKKRVFIVLYFQVLSVALVCSR